MNLTFTLGWWLIPMTITIGAFTWALWDRKDERSTGGMFDGMGAAIMFAIRVPVAACASLLAWLAWSLLA